MLPDVVSGFHERCFDPVVFRKILGGNFISVRQQLLVSFSDNVPILNMLNFNDQFILGLEMIFRSHSFIQLL